MMNEAEIDPLILPLVKYLNKNNFKTFMSCQGGEGHMFEHPIIGIDVDDLNRLRNSLIECLEGINVCEFDIDCRIGVAIKGCSISGPDVPLHVVNQNTIWSESIYIKFSKREDLVELNNRLKLRNVY